MFLQFNFDGIISPRTGFFFNHVLNFFVVYTKSTQGLYDFNCVVTIPIILSNHYLVKHNLSIGVGHSDNIIFNYKYKYFKTLILFFNYRYLFII